MLRIVEESTAHNATTLRLDGRLAGQWVELLRASCERALENKGRLSLDLTGVSFADHEGLRLLRCLDGQQIALLHGSPFLREQMKGFSNGQPPIEESTHAHERRG